MAVKSLISPKIIYSFFPKSNYSDISYFKIEKSINMVLTQPKTLLDRILFWVLINNRWIFVLFLLPISVVYNFYFYFRNWLVFKLNSAPNKHDEKVRNVQSQVRKWSDNGAKNQMCTARPGWTTTSLRVGLYKKTMTNIEVNLNDVLNVDTNKQTVRVEQIGRAHV